MLVAYFGRLIHFAFRHWVWRTDAMQIVVASLLPAIPSMLGIELPEWIPQNALAYIGYAIVFLIIIRLLVGPYFIWKEDQKTIADLREELRKPETKMREKLADGMAEAREELADYASRMYMNACQGKVDLETFRNDLTRGHLFELTSRLDYDETFSELWTKFVGALIKIQTTRHTFEGGRLNADRLISEVRSDGNTARKQLTQYLLVQRSNQAS